MTQVTRRKFIKTAGVGGVGAAAVSIAAPAIAQSAPEIKWRLTASWPKSLDTLFGGREYFAKRIAEIDRQQFQIQPFAAGEIVARPASARRRANGTVEMGHTALYYYWGKDPALTSALPAVRAQQPADERLAALRRRHRAANDFYASYNCSASPPAIPARRWAAGSARRSSTVDDLKGLKFRVGGFAGTILAKLGVVPQQLAGGDIYPALEKGTIDASEWVGPYDDEKLGFHKVAQYYYYPGWWEGCGQAAQPHQPRQVERAAQNLPGGDHARPAANLGVGAGQVRLSAIRRRSSVWSAAAPQLRPFPAGHHGGLLQGRQRDLCRASRRTNPHFKKTVREPDGLPRATPTSGCRWPSYASTPS